MNDQLLCRVIFTITNFRNLGAFYHLTSRGNERKAVFKSRRDREQFLSYLESATERYGALIHVYCLMDNVHAILGQPECRIG